MDEDDYLDRPHTVTPRLGWATVVVSISTLLFGYHLAELNAPADIIACRFSKPGPELIWDRQGFPQCLPMEDGGVALANTMYTLGGLAASVVLGASSLPKQHGRRKLITCLAILYVMGSVLMTLATSTTMLYAGRFFVGVGAGGSLIVSPILINELTPINHRGLLGSLLQVSVACGIFIAQFVSYFWSNELQWRSIFAFALVLATLLLVGLFSVAESPKWLVIHKGDVNSATSLLVNLRSDMETVPHEIAHWRRLSSNEYKLETVSISSETRPLLPIQSGVSLRRGSFDDPSISFHDYFTLAAYRRELAAVLILMTSQQLTGINAITFYGVQMLNKLFDHADLSNVLVLAATFSLVNVVSSIVVSHYFERFGRRPLMLMSVATTALCATLIACGLAIGNPVMIVVACYGFIVGYSIGLGPVPFLMIAEFASHETVALAQSVGTSLNWGTGMIVAFSVPLLLSWIGGGVFFIFAIFSAAYFVLVWWVVPETKGYSNTYDVWEDFLGEAVHTEV